MGPREQQYWKQEQSLREAIPTFMDEFGVVHLAGGQTLFDEIKCRVFVTELEVWEERERLKLPR